MKSFVKAGLKIVLCPVLTAFLLSLTGCSARIDYTLPDDPVLFTSGTFINPDDPEDRYYSIEYNGRTYIAYGTFCRRITGDDVGKCLGYEVRDGAEDKDLLFYALTGDTGCDLLVRIDAVGFMSQPDFFRAVDTKWKDVFTADFLLPENPDCITFWD